MSPNNGRTGSDWQDVGKVAEELAEFTRNRNIPMTTAAQRKAKDRPRGDKEFKDNKIDVEDLGRSKMVGDNANIVFIIEQRSEEHLREDMNIHIVKNRDGPKGKVVLKKEFDKSRILDFPDNWVGDPGDENEI
jgi:replicative DNA helicase